MNALSLVQKIIVFYLCNTPKIKSKTRLSTQAFNLIMTMMLNLQKIVLINSQFKRAWI